MAADHGMARMQELLSSYYGMQDQQSEAASQRDIDSPGFDARVYARELLQTLGLNELLQRDDRLIREIKELDTNMQMLVYENYNKFISATDTIRKMKTNVASMEREVEQVVRSMDGITDKSERINVALAPHRSKVERLLGVRRLLKRLEFIFELPQRLHAAVKHEDFANATRSYLLARRILGRYEHITSFRAIQAEAEKIVQGLVAQLRRRLWNPQLTSEQVCEALALLAQLEACTDEMKQQFLDWHQAYFEKLLGGVQSPTEDSVLACLRDLNDRVLGRLQHVFRVYTDHFLPDLGAAKSTRASITFQDDPFATFAKETFAMYLNVCATQFRRPHPDFGSLSEVQSVLAETGELTSADPDAFAGAEEEYFVFMWVLKHFMAQVREIDAIVPPCRLLNGAIEVIENGVRFQIDLVFRKLRTETLDLLQKAHQQVNANSRHTSRTHSAVSGSSHNLANFQAPSVQLMAQDMASTFSDMMKQVLKQMEPLVQTGATILKEMSRIFSDLVQSQFYQFLKWFNASILTYTEPKRAFLQSHQSVDKIIEEDEVNLPWLEPSPLFLLYLACICRELASDGISDCLQVLIECLPSESANNTTARHAQPDHNESARSKPQFEVTHMIQVTRETADEVLQHIAKMYGLRLCTQIRSALCSSTAWTELSEEPRSVQDVMMTVIELVFQFGKEIALGLGDEQSGFLNSSGSRTGSRDFRRRTSGLRSRGAAGGGMQLDIERIFAKRIQIFHPGVELSTDWFIQSILKMTVKAYGEWVREFELSQFALQQVQLDAEFLRSTAVHLVADSQELESLLSDILSNARERARVDILMEQSSVVAIVSSKSAQALSRKS